MTNDDRSLPLGTSSFGAGGVSPQVSMMEDTPFGRPAGLRDAPVKEAALVTVQQHSTRSERTSPSPLLPTLPSPAGAGLPFSLQAINEALAEATRVNAEKALGYARDLATVKSPSEFMAVQAAFWEDQRTNFMAQTERLRQAAMQFFERSNAPLFSKPAAKWNPRRLTDNREGTE